MKVTADEIFWGLGDLTDIGAPAVRTLLVIDDFQPLFSHYAPYDLLGDVCTFSFEPGVYGSVAPAPLAFSKHRSHLCPESFILVLTQTATVVLIGALRYLQESDD